MKSQILAIATLLPFHLSGAPPFKVELIAPQEEPIAIEQEQFDAAAPLAKAAEEKAALLKKGKLDAEKLREIEAVLAKGRTLNQGISLKLRFTNPGDKSITIHYGPDTSINILTVEGPAAIDLPYMGAMTADFRQPKPTTIEAGGSKEFPIDELHYGMRDMSRWLIGKPGSYTITLRFVTRLDRKKVELTTNKVTLKVRARE